MSTPNEALRTGFFRSVTPMLVGLGAYALILAMGIYGGLRVEQAGAPGEAQPAGLGEVRKMEAEGAPEPAAAPVAALGVEDVEDGAFLDVVGVVPVEGDIFRGDLVVFFDEEIVVPELVDGKTVEPFEISPELTGRFRVGANYIAFRAPKVERAAYTVKLGEHIRSKTPGRSGEPKTVNPLQQTFQVAGFLFSVDRVWFVEKNENGTVLDVLFSSPVDAGVLPQFVTASDAAGNAVTLGFDPGSTPATFRLKLPPGAAEPVTLLFDKGLTDSQFGFTLGEERTFTYPSERPLQVLECQWGEFGQETQKIRIRFSQPVQPGRLAQSLKLVDKDTGEAVAFELADQESHWQTATVKLKTPSDVAVDVVVAKGLLSQEMTVLREDFARTLERRPVAVTIDGSWWSWEGREGTALTFYLNRTVPLQEIRSHLEIEPAIQNMRVDARYGTNFAVYGDWDSNKNYELRLKEGMKDGEDIALPKTLSLRVKSERVPAYIGFGYEGKYYFPKRSGGSMPILTRNVDKAKFELHAMFPGNIAVALDDMEHDRLESLIDSWSKKVGETELKTVNVPDRMAETRLELDALFPAGRKGVFCLKAQAYDVEGRPWGPSEAKLILFTEIGVLAHWQSDELVLFAHDLFSLAPRSQAQVTLYSAKNQILGQGTTNEQGIVRLGPLDETLGSPRVVVVEHNDDFTFLELEARNDAPGSDMANMPPYDSNAYDAFLYADRDLYRPGETIHLRWIVRKNHGEAVPNVPLLVTVVKPNGRDLLSRPTVLSELGTAGLDVTTEKSYPTGKYTVNLTVPGSENAIGQYQFSLEEFVPNRIKTAVTVEAAHFVAGREYAVGVNAQHLFGAPAAGRRTEAKIYLMRDEFKAEAWPGFRFGNDSDFTPDSIECGEAQTDDAGAASFQFTYRAPAAVTFPLKAVAVGSVFELGGRAVSGKAERTMFPSETCLGVLVNPKPETGSIEAIAAAIQPDGTPAALGKVTITLEKQIWDYYVRRYYSHNEPNWSESFDPLESREVDLVDGKGTASFSVQEYGYYRIRVHSDQTPQYSTVAFYSYGGQCEVVSSAEQSLLKLVFDKEEYEVGEEARVRVESPFDGQGIVVLQTGTIQQMLPVQIVGGVGEVSIRVEEQYFPNVWVEATVIHAVQVERAQVYPFSSFGMKTLKVSDKRKALQVAFPSLPEEIRPAGPAEVAIETRDADGAPVSAELTLAAVDEGIHGITEYKSPEPYGWLKRPRRPDYRRAHYYDRVAYDFDKPAAGGDMEDEMGKRLATGDESWIKTVALWSGVVKTDAEGKATVTMDVPEFTGQLRLVAVACSDTALGSVSKQLFVRRTYMMQTSMPRFLLPGDAFQCRAVVYNNSDAACRAKVSWQSSGTIQENAGSQELDVPAHGEANCTAGFTTGIVPGQGEIRWEAVITDAGGQEVERLMEAAPIPVRTPAAFQSHHELAVLKVGESRAFRNTQFVDDERAELEVTVGASPQLRLQEALKYVVHYPYGCVEQTTSCLMPLYALRSSSALVEEMLDDTETWENYINAGIHRLFAMQTSSGGLAVWPGGTEPYPYGSIYALHFLTLVKRSREFDLPVESFKALQDYVRGVAQMDLESSEPPMYFPSHEGSRLYQRAYAIYVLALDGDLEAIRQIERFDHIVLPTAARFLLAAALARNTEDIDRVKLYLSSAPSGPYDVTEPDTTLSSDIRNTAIELLAMNQMGEAVTPELKMTRVNKLVQWLENNRYGTTQETAFVTTALADFFGAIEANVESAAASIDGVDGAQSIAGRDVYRGNHAGAGGVFTVSNTGQTELFVDVTMRGVPEKVEWTPVSEGVEVQRAFLTADGTPYEETSFRQGDTYIVKVTVECGQPVKNFVVADLLAAGLEVENPRLDTTVMAGTDLPAAVSPSFLEIRDDRVVTAYDELAEGTSLFYYVVRAVTPGEYQHPPIEAECMYDAKIRGRSVPTTVKVE